MMKPMLVQKINVKDTKHFDVVVFVVEQIAYVPVLMQQLGQ